MSSAHGEVVDPDVEEARARPGARGRQLGFGSGHVAVARYACVDTETGRVRLSLRAEFYVRSGVCPRTVPAPGCGTAAVMRANLAPSDTLPRGDPHRSAVVFKSGRPLVPRSDMADSPLLSEAPSIPRRRLLLGAALGAGCLLSARASAKSADDAMAAAELKRAAERADLCSASNATGSGLRGEYFAKEPLAAMPLLVRVDTTIDFDATLDWPANLAGRRPSAARWSGWVKPPYTRQLPLPCRAACGTRASSPDKSSSTTAAPRERRSISTRDGSIRSMSRRAGSMRWSAG